MDGAMTASEEQRVLDLFGLARLRTAQRALISLALGGHSCLGVLPTGYGKSLCYQAAAVLLPGTSLVVSPLLALMKEQAGRLEELGIAARRFDSSLTPDARRQTLQELAEGRVRLLFAAPESLENEQLTQALAGVSRGLFVVDEAHCVSVWGHSFRPDYLKLPGWAASHGWNVVMALTATASAPVRSDLRRAFAIGTEAEIVRSPYRPNIDRRVAAVAEDEHDATLLAFLRDPEHLPAIVYCPTRRATEELADRLAREGLPARAYHAGQPAEVRERIQDAFLHSCDGVLVATIAFGMGIDKPDVRSVVHDRMPPGPEAYVQESGRAGRDGKPSWSLVLRHAADARRIRNRILASEPERDALVRCLRWLLPAGSRVVSWWEVSTECDIAEDVVQRLLALLQGRGAIAIEAKGMKYFRAKPLFPLETILDGRDEAEKDLLAWIAEHRDAEVAELADAGHMPWDRALEFLGEMELSGEWTISLRQQAALVRTLDATLSPVHLAEEVADYYRRRRDADLERLHAWEAMLDAPRCINASLEAYFEGGGNASPCGHCSMCRGEETRVPALRQEAPWDASPAAALLGEGRSALQRPAQRARFLLGLSGPASMRARLWAHPAYGCCEGAAWEELLAYCTR